MTSLSNINNDDSSSTTTHTHLENLLLETLMKRIQLHDPDNVNDDNSPSRKSFEDFLFGSDDDEDDAPRPGPYQDGKKAIYREESRVEGEIIKLILSGKGDTLKPNSGEAVSIRESSICVGCHEEEEGEYVVWEWHGHIMGYSDEHGFSPEYIYGNYFQRIVPLECPYSPPVGDEVDDVVSKGLKDLIDDADTDADADADDASPAAPARILHRSLNAGSAPPRF